MTMMLAIPIAPTSSATAPSPTQQGGELALGGGARLERVGGTRDVDAARVLGVGGRRKQVGDAADVVLARRGRRSPTGWAAVPNNFSATGSEMNTVESSEESRTIGFRIPTTVNHRSPR